jgi:superfamily I DNA/RNA helicase
MAVSLTRTAAAELGGRDGTVLRPELCATLHAHAYRALEEPDLAETPASMREFLAAHPALAGDHHAATEDETSTNIPAIHAAVTNHRARMTPRDQWTDSEREYMAAWDDYKHATNRLDFTDLIERCLRNGVLPLTRPRVALYDEAQDQSALEFELAAMWARDTLSTVMVGDAAQAIYWFRGADADRLEQIPVARNETLDQSYRCPATVAALAQRWAAQLPGEQLAWKPTGIDGHTAETPYALRDTQDVIDHAQSHVAAGQTTMILATCRYMLTPLCAALKAQGVTFSNPWRLEETSWNPLGEFAAGNLVKPSAGNRAVLALLRPLNSTWGDDARFWTWGDLLDLTEPMQASALARGAKASIAEHCRADEFGQTRANDEIKMSTLLTLLGPAGERLLDLDRDEQGVIDWWTGTLLARGLKQTQYALTVKRKLGGAALRQPPRLFIGTVHSTKGSEADVVLLSPELSKEAYYQNWLSKGPGHDAIVRLGYVAATRAKRELHVMEPGTPESMPIGDLIRHPARAA